MIKKISALLFLSFTACASSLVYCPETAQCTEGQCTFEQDANNYWSAIIKPNSPNILSDGKYPVTYVSAPYRVEDGGHPICVYTHPYSQQTLMLRARSNAQLIIFEDDQTTWRHEESWGECRPNPLSDCPLQRELIW